MRAREGGGREREGASKDEEGGGGSCGGRGGGKVVQTLHVDLAQSQRRKGQDSIVKLPDF